MAYSKAKLKSNDGKASPRSKTFWIGKLSDKCLPTLNLLYVSFKYILISLIMSMGTQNSKRIVHGTSILSES
jgi:hypothetical protein